MSTTIAVIGSGALGLMAMKNFQEDGFDVTGFESRPYVGGLWKKSSDSTISVHATTKFNSSRYRSAISDFPFPDDTSDYPSAPEMHEYLCSYSDHFGLAPRIRLSTKIVNMEREGAKWKLTVQPRDGPERIEYFDKVAVATGSFYKPKTVKFEGMEKFQGEVIHSIEYHGPEPFRNKNVLTIGIHASAQDVAASLNGSASKVYMSHRHGLILMPRYSADGAVIDSSGGLRMVLAQTFMTQWLPSLWNWIFDKAVSSISRKSFDVKPEWGFSPVSSIAVSTPLIADELYPLLKSGFATPVTEVRRIVGAKTIELTDGTILSDIDAIIQCTGYDFAIPFIPASSPYQPYPVIGEPPLLYRNIFPLDPDPSVRNSLAFLGQVGITFPGFVPHELVSQAVSQIWQGKTQLPPLKEMKSWHSRYIQWRKDMTRQYGPSSTFYAVFVPFSDHLRWVDRTAGTGILAHFDWAWFNWRSWRLWWQDRDLYNICIGGLLSPAVWRLFDCGGRKVWDGARAQIFRDNEAVKRQKEERLRFLQEKKAREARKTVNGHVELKKD